MELFKKAISSSGSGKSVEEIVMLVPFADADGDDCWALIKTDEAGYAAYHVLLSENQPFKVDELGEIIEMGVGDAPGIEQMQSFLDMYVDA